MVDVLFGQSYFLKFDAKLWQAMQPFPPLGTLYAASYLRHHGYRVAVFDAMLAEDEQAWARAIETHRPSFAVLYEDNFNYLSKMCLLRMREAAFAMIASAKKAGLPVIVAGADANDHAPLYLERGADFVIRGEGEQTLLELINFLSTGSHLSMADIPGLVWKDVGLNGEMIRFSPPREPIKDLDALPFPAWDLVDIEHYRRIWREKHGYFAMNLVTTRGCPYHCNWCAKPIWGQRYHSRSVQNVVREIAWLLDVYQPDYLWFVDDIFGLKPGWIEKFALELQANRICIPFKCLSRADLLLRPGEVQALRSAGVDIVWIGAESGSQKVLDAMEKGITVEQIRNATRLLKSYGIHVGFFLQFGYPGEGLAEIDQTFRMVRECQPEDIGISVSYPLPGTKFYQKVRDQLKERQNWIDSEDLAMLYQGPFSTEFYRQLHRTLHTEFRLLKSWMGLTKQRLIGTRFVKNWSKWKLIGHLVSNSLRLPYEKWRLFRLARRPHSGITALPVTLSYAQASQPTPQEELTRTDTY